MFIEDLPAPVKEENMQKKQHVAIILFMILTVLILLPACSKKTTETEAPDVTMQEEDMEAQKVREQLEQERREREAKARELRAEKIKFMYEDIYFKKGSYKLAPEARELLKRKALWLQKNPGLKVIVEGHADEAGSKEYNLALGDRRAGAVKSFLIRQGIQSGRLIAVSYGNEHPIDTGSMETAHSKNRRVHFVVEE
jgi:peptidoglycan-associated lipoprotein